MLRIICANPDIMVERGEQLLYCAGALAADYEAKGGKVTYAGKPHTPIYDRTLREISRLKGRPVAKEKHSLHRRRRRDRPQGAHNAGFRSVFIASPIFLPEGLSAPALTKLFADRPFSPVAALPALTW